MSLREGCVLPTKQSQVTTEQEIVASSAPQATRNGTGDVMRNKQYYVYILTNSRHTVL